MRFCIENVIFLGEDFPLEDLHLFYLSQILCQCLLCISIRIDLIKGHGLIHTSSQDTHSRQKKKQQIKFTDPV